MIVCCTQCKKPETLARYDIIRCHIEFALEQGLCIFPVLPKTKKPAVDWKEFQKRKPTYEEIQEWWFGELAKQSFNIQFGTFMAHYLRNKLSKIVEKTLEWEEPWCYKEWRGEFPKSAGEFYELLTSKDFTDFVKEHVEKGFTWGWTKLVGKRAPELLNLIQQLVYAKNDAPAYAEGLKTCENLLESVKEFWTWGYADEFREKIGESGLTIGDVLFKLKVKGEKEKEPSISDIASLTGLSFNIVRNRIMPKIQAARRMLV